MNRNGSGESAGSWPFRALGAKLGALLRRIPRRLARGETDEARRTSIVESSEDAITSATLEGVIVSWNPGAERMYGYTAEEAVGRTVWELMRPSGGSDVVAKNVVRIRWGERVAPFEAVHHHRSGRRLHVSVHLAPVKDAAGEVVGVSSINRDVTEREEAEGALREAEARYRTLVEQIPAVTYVQEIGHIYTTLYVSPQMEALVGYPPEDFYSDPGLWYGVVHPDDLERVAAEDERTDETGEPFRMEYRMCHKDGRVAWVRDEAILVEDGEGRPRFWQGAMFDITDRKRAEQKILFQARLLDTVGQAAVAVDLDGRITYWNRFAETLYGWPAREVVGRPASEILTPEDQQGRADEVMSELRAGSSWVGEFEARRRDGTSFVAMVTDTPVYDEQGNLAGVIGVSTDVTERKEAEDSLRRSKARFQAVFENAAVGMALVNMEGRLMESNPALQEMLGYGDEELRSMTWVELTHPDDVDLDRSYFERLVAGELDRYQFEKRYARKDGRVIWGHLTGSVIRGAEDEPHLMVGMVEDITERRRAEEALRESHDLLQVVMEGTTDAVYVKDRQCRYLMVNSACARFLGRPAEEVIGNDDSELFSPEDGRKVMEDDRDIMTTGTLRTSEDIKTVESVARTYLTVKGPYRDHQGNVAGVFGVSRDITERKRAEEALRESEARFRSSFGDASIGMALVGLDGRWLEVNPALCGIVGYPEEELLEKTFQDITHPDDLEADLGHARRMLDGRITTYQMEKRYFHKLGHEVWVLHNVSLVRDAAGSPLYFISQIQDITERKRAEEALKESEERFRSAFEDAPIGVTLVGLDNRYLRVNRAFCEMLGRSEEDLVGAASSEITHPDDLEVSKAYMERVLEEDGGDHKYDLEKRYLHADGHPVWVLLSVSLVRDSRGEPSHYVCQHQDVSERKELEQRLEHQAFHDPLTDLPNRVLFMDRLGQALARMSRRELPVAVLYIDLDGFKTVNDTLGHEVGDQLLVAVAGRLRECVRPEDTLARLGGDEFTVLVEGTSGLEDAERVTRRILERLRAPINIGGREVFTSANVGIASAEAEHRDPAKLLRNADLAMYGSKKRGRGGYKIFEASEDDAVLSCLELGGDLRRALEREEFEIYYLPEVSVETGRVESMEALVRWEHPRRGLLEPGDFLPVAEVIGLILAIEERVLLEVCQQGRAWQERRAGHPPLRVCTNVSETLFSQTDLVERVAAVVRETGLEAQNLSLEIAERVLADGSDATVGKLEALKELGVRVVIEDFGMAYSALAVLRRFPLNFLKLDRSLVARLDEEPENAAIVEATINLAHALGWAVTAHGVGTAGQLARLRKMEADLAQGYHFSRPITAEEATALLEQDLRRHGPGGVV